MTVAPWQSVRLRVLACDDSVVSLDVVETEFVNFRDGGVVGQWIDVVVYRLAAEVSDTAAIESLLAHWTYDHTFAQPRKTSPRARTGLHGPYHLQSIGAESFRIVSADAARMRVESWATQWGPLPLAFGHSVAELLDRTFGNDPRVYELADLAETEKHEWGWVVGSDGFVEFVVISSDRNTLTLFVASDD
jgi:hypothetical protein